MKEFLVDRGYCTAEKGSLYGEGKKVPLRGLLTRCNIFAKEDLHR